MGASVKYIYWLKEATEADKSIVGYKGWALAKLKANGFNVPNAFILSSDFIEKMLTEQNILKKLQTICKSATKNNLQETAFACQKVVLDMQIQENSSNAQEIIDYYEVLEAMPKDFEKTQNVAQGLVEGNATVVAVRLSSKHKTESNLAKLAITGTKQLFAAIKSLLASYYSKENLTLNTVKELPAIIIQEMLPSQKSGILFTSHPITNEANSSVIEAVHGMGTSLYQDEVIADSYLLSNNPREVISREIDPQQTALYFDNASLGQKEIPKHIQNRQTLTDRECLELTRQGQKAKALLGKDASLRFGIVKEHIHILSVKEMPTISTQSEMSISKKQVNNQEKKDTTIKQTKQEEPVFVTNDPEKVQMLTTKTTQENNDQSAQEDELNEDNLEENEDEESGSEDKVEDDIPPIEFELEEDELEEMQAAKQKDNSNTQEEDNAKPQEPTNSFISKSAADAEFSSTNKKTKSSKKKFQKQRVRKAKFGKFLRR